MTSYVLAPPHPRRFIASILSSWCVSDILAGFLCLLRKLTLGQRLLLFVQMVAAGSGSGSCDHSPLPSKAQFSSLSSPKALSVSGSGVEWIHVLINVPCLWARLHKAQHSLSELTPNPGLASWFPRSNSSRLGWGGAVSRGQQCVSSL